MKKQFNLISFLLIALLLLISGCTQSPLEPNEEEKDYVKDDYMKQTYDVELANYEFEERLNSFYESEPISMSELSDLYDDEIPEGGSDPRALRVHWEDARELALAEVELQKDILDWDMVDVSERPILVLDREGGDFYRYYEYRVSKNSNEIGAVRIPAYRRTENFSTAEVHNYSAGGTSYTIEPTAWGAYIASRMFLDEDTEFYKNMVEDISQYITEEDDNILYNILYRLYADTGLVNKRSSVTETEAYNLLYKNFIEASNNLSGTKEPFTKRDKEEIADAAALSKTVELKNNLEKLEFKIYKRESIALLLKSSNLDILDLIYNTILNNFFSGIQISIFNMADYSDNTTFRYYLRDMIWKHIESQLGGNIQIQNYLFNLELNPFKEMDELRIKPIVEYPNIGNYPTRLVGNSTDNLIYSEFTLIENTLHSSYLNYHIAFEMPNNKYTSLFDNTPGFEEYEFSIKENSSLIEGSILSLTDLYNMVANESENSEKIQANIEVSFDYLLGESTLLLDNFKNEFLKNTFKNYPNIQSRMGIKETIDIVVQLMKYIEELKGYFKTAVKNQEAALDKAIAELEKQLTDNGLTLVDVIDSIDKMLEFEENRVPRDQDMINELSMYKIIIDQYIRGRKNIIEHIARNIYDLWVVFPFLPIPYIYSVPLWGGVGEWEWQMGVPLKWTKNVERYVAENMPQTIDSYPTQEEPENPEYVLVPDVLLEVCPDEWLSVNLWLTGNLNFNGGDNKFSKLTYEQVENFKQLLITDMLNVYGKDMVYDQNNNLVPNPSYELKDIRSKYNINTYATNLNVDLLIYDGYKRNN